MLEIQQLFDGIESGTLTEHSIPGLELKSAWSQDVGKEISSLANDLSIPVKWLVIGIDDKGKLLGKPAEWLTSAEQQASNHIYQFLSPTWACSLYPKTSDHGSYLMIEVRNPGDVTHWNGKAWKRIGTSKYEILSLEEELQLAQRLPGQDFSKQPFSTNISSSLVLKFAEKVNEQQEDETEKIDTKTSSANEILSRLRINDTRTTDILFGTCKARVIKYNAEGDIVEKKEYGGLYSILDDDFIAEIQSWTRKNAAAIIGNSSSIVEEIPYPKFAIRETLANAVAHANFALDNGGIFIEVHPDRLVIKNNALRTARNFMGKWFSRDSYVSNKLLMVTLRAAGVTDEAGNGKVKTFRSMLEMGKPEPKVHSTELNQYNDKWSVTLYSLPPDKNILNLIDRIKAIYPQPEAWRLATAMVLWRHQTWEEIVSKLDPHYQAIANRMQQDDYSPFFVYEGHVYLKRWADVALQGQISMKFSPSAEEAWKNVIMQVAKQKHSEGIIEFSEIRNMLGLSNTKSETAFLSGLLKKWEHEGIVQHSGKKGYWKFL